MAPRSPKNLLVRLKLFKSVGETVRCFESLFAPNTFLEFEYEKPSNYIKSCWEAIRLWPTHFKFPEW